MKVYVRDLTTDEDLELNLPMEALPFKPNHEYIIVDSDIDCGQYYNIEKLNNFLKETEVEQETLEILNSVYNWDEVVEAVEKGNYTILDFDDITSSWNAQFGVSATEHNLGRAMYDEGYNELPCEVPKELEDYIEWEQNWFTLETLGWSTTSHWGRTYIVHK